MATITGPAVISRVTKEGRFLSQDGGRDLRPFSFGRDLSHSSNRHSHSDLDEVPKYGPTLKASGEEADMPSIKKPKLGHVKVESSVGQPSHLEKVLAKISPESIRVSRPESDHSSLRTSRIPQSSDTLPVAGLAETVNSHTQDDKVAELLRLKKELLAANSKIAMQEQELAQNRVIKHTLDQALGPPSEADFGGRDITEQTISNLQNAFNASNPAFGQFQDAWSTQDDSHSDISDALSAGAYNRGRGLWNQNGQSSFGMDAQDHSLDKAYGEALPGPSRPVNQDSGRFWSAAPMYPTGFGVSQGGFQPHRISSGPSTGGYDCYPRPPGEQSRFFQNTNPESRLSPTHAGRGGPIFPPQNTPWAALAFGTPSDATPKSPGSPPTRSPSVFQPIGIYPVSSYPARPGATTLSPTASEFTAGSVNSSLWTNASSSGGSSMQTYVSPLEPLNYRRLLDKNVSCDWKYIVDKIVCNNDQQASIFLQQKLKVGTSEQKFDIIEAIVSQAYPLMVNRFGNFLVQRCFEHGTPDQVVAIANAIRGNTLNLSMDSFGCHVIQKAFDCVPQEHKTIMVHELLRRIPETVVHRYACHVWQKLFELRWSGDPPQIMAKVNEALEGMWHEVALGETGSLVVQNIFENCIEEEKRPAIEEVLVKIDLLAHGQFGNWCIQHICEHGAPHDKSRAVEHVLHHAVDYSMDQFASKIVEKCLKIGGSEFLDRYLSRVCTGRSERPRMPLIDIAGDQYGNYLIQWVLMNAAAHQRELVASHIRKHMVSLRGSKFGSRVAMLCCNPSHATRPGPGTGIQVGRFSHFNDERISSTNSTNNG
ncbi:Putative Pumilio-family RNA binding repeat protein [Penicillium brasilianum]|uniref:Putative Pumilio-family RNA binding repeat protein n=1 Tax=Penicillium brasilianum TaxID=104259 RepID=A0A0F7U3X9_PENBI|nr:Putative Pumilio-family RNA binding repeat protein [Penicillium brasilianum]